MKKIYERPVITGLELSEREDFLAASLEKGIYDPRNAMGKEGSLEEEKVETGIPSKFTSLWGDEEEEED